jgi:hypothetical protein
MTPGPDGCFAQLIFWRPGALSGVIDGLRAQAKQAHIDLVEVPKLEFWPGTKWYIH